MPSIDTIKNELKNIFGDRNITYLEIGARYGDSTKFIIDNFNVDKTYIIDPYESYDDYKSYGFNDIIKNSEDLYFGSIKEKFSSYNVEFIREYSNSLNAINKIEDNSIDLCFIDGNHEYQYVYDDIKNYLPKIKKGGIICGDDYFMRHKDINKYPEKGYDRKMVYEAVQDFFKGTDYKIEEYGIHNGHGKTWLVRV